METEVGLGKHPRLAFLSSFLASNDHCKRLKEEERDTINSALVHGNSKENVQSYIVVLDTCFTVDIKSSEDA